MSVLTRMDSSVPPALLRAITLGFVSLLVLKTVFAVALDLYSDEIFYWQASTFPAIAYSDLPFIAALLAGIGSAFFGNEAWAVRSLFLVMGTAIPLLVYWVACPHVPKRQAIEAAGLTLCLPLGGFLGVLAVPDVPLLFFGLLFLGSLDRATRDKGTRYWIAAGIAAALGVSTHYRFVLSLLAAFACLVGFPQWHRFWRTPGLWCAAALLLLGLYPALSFNLTHDLSGVDYHLLERHPWEFQAEGLLHSLKQAMLVTPLLYIALWACLFSLLAAARRGDMTRGLFGGFALCHLAVYLLLAPWTDNTRTSIHWPLSGYLPLLVFLPETLRSLGQWLLTARVRIRPQRLLTTLIGMGYIGSLVAVIGVGAQAFQDVLGPHLSYRIFSNKMAGWRDFNQTLGSVLSQEHAGPTDIVVTDNYYTAAQVAFGHPDLAPIYTLDADKSIRDGRAVQYALWQLDASALQQLPSPSGFYVTEDSTLTVPDKIAALIRACNVFDTLRLVHQITLLGGEKRFSVYRGDASTDDSRGVCPLPSLGWIDGPDDNALVGDSLQISGWVINEGMGVSHLEILLDGASLGRARYGLPRPDVVTAMNVQTDPNAPALGFDFSYPTTGLAKGRHSLSVRVTGISGEVQEFGQRRIVLP